MAISFNNGNNPTSITFNNNNVNAVYFNGTRVWPYSIPSTSSCVAIVGDNDFTIKSRYGMNYDKSSGKKFEYSLDGITWRTYNSIYSNFSASTTYKVIFLRGTGITSYAYAGSALQDATVFNITGANVSLFGDIETLLDYQTVMNGRHPTYTDRTFAHMFSSCTAITDISGLIIKMSGNYPKYGLFHTFDGCSNLETLPKFTIYSRVLPEAAQYMFDECPKIKIYNSSSAAHSHTYRVSNPNHVTNGTGDNYAHFYLIFADNPDYGISGDTNYRLDFNTTYYVAWEPTSINDVIV